MFLILVLDECFENKEARTVILCIWTFLIVDSSPLANTFYSFRPKIDCQRLIITIVSRNSNILISRYPLKWIYIYMDCQRNLEWSDVIRIVLRHFIISIRLIVGLSSVLVFVFVLEPSDIFHIWQVIIVLWEITTSVVILLFCDLSYSVPKWTPRRLRTIGYLSHLDHLLEHHNRPLSTRHPLHCHHLLPHSNQGLVLVQQFWRGWGGDDSAVNVEGISGRYRSTCHMRIHRSCTQGKLSVHPDSPTHSDYNFYPKECKTSQKGGKTLEDWVSSQSWRRPLPLKHQRKAAFFPLPSSLRSYQTYG